MEDGNISYIFSEEGGDIRNKVDIIVGATSSNRDNHSAFLIRVLDDEGDGLRPCKLEETKASVHVPIAVDHGLSRPVCNVNRPLYKTGKFWIVLFVAVLAILGIAFLVSKCSGSELQIPKIGNLH